MPDVVNPDMQFNSPPGEDSHSTLCQAVFETIKYLEHDDQFLFLTKCPWNLKKWGTFPDNAWAGASGCNTSMMFRAVDGLQYTKAKNKWLSIEPLLEQIKPIPDFASFGINWVVIGGQTQPTMLPQKEWIDEIVAAADKAGIPVWLKNNLKPLMGVNLRQEYPLGL